MRLKSAIWVAAYVRRCNGAGSFAAVRRRGADEAGAIYIKINRLDGTATLYGPAPQSSFDDSRPSDRAFIAMLGSPQPVPEGEVDAKLAREIKFDSDLWVVEIESRDGSSFIEEIVT
ncbi:MAG: DUF1491 family protein [Pseudolabrys sp.]|nr:DUF1491 family protein [Pseudolabrys sp.]MBV9260280.1 DUF1491 family protein [Pseudolabrys sp.]